jgi:preprotein translocase subunit SecF
LKTQFDFLRYRRLWIIASMLLITIGLGEFFLGGPLNFGIDLAGGHQLNVVFRDDVAVSDIRKSLTDAGLSATVQPFDNADRSYLIRLSLISERETGGIDAGNIAVSALDQLVGNDPRALDINRVGVASLAEWLAGRDPEVLSGALTRDEAEHSLRERLSPLAEARREQGVIAAWSELEVAGLAPEIVSQLKDSAQIGGFSIVGQETVGPQIGSELRTQALLAVVLSMAGMLFYIWWRFELPYALGAMAATLHDVAVVCGIYALSGFEINLATVAGFLTLIGYSVNDTVVIFDRVRENRRIHPREPVLEVMNASLNQTLRRTIMTSGTTLLAVGPLLFLGGDVLRGLSFVLFVGVIVGTYSSVYIASPVALFFFERRERIRRRDRPAPLVPATATL